MQKSIFTTAQITLLKEKIQQWSTKLGFDGVGFSDTNLTRAEESLFKWLGWNRHGEMAYMYRHGTRRTRPTELVSGTISVISFRMNYFPKKAAPAIEALQNPNIGYISRYALGRDYHKLIRQRLQQLANHITTEIGPFNYRAFADSAPVMEKPLAVKAGLGWIGKHTNLISHDRGSWFFLGELYTDLPLPVDQTPIDHCGSCSACISACPTGAIVAPYQLDARLCISYLTIEHKSSIPLTLRPLIGNRIFGCDDCQLACPWNRDAPSSGLHDFEPRYNLDHTTLLDLFEWSEEDFERKTTGSPIHRIGYDRWLRNLAVALGNGPGGEQAERALRRRLCHPSALVREHVQWALECHARVNQHSNSIHRRQV